MTCSDSPAWQLVRAAAAAARDTRVPLVAGRRYALQGEALQPVESAELMLVWSNGWRSHSSTPADLRAFLDLYLPFAAGRASAPHVAAQLGQSLDGFIATSSGHSHYVTGDASLTHLHRLRALSDCVIVGAGTVAADDPRLTTRRVEGANPLRVVLDPQLRLPLTHQVFCDGQAPTLRIRAQGVPLPATLALPTVEDIEVPAPAGRLHLPGLLSALRARGHYRVLVEGGGITVSAFLTAGLLDRLHLVVAPFIMGEGRPGLRVASPLRLQDCQRPPPCIYAVGSDVLFDCDLRAQPTVPDSSSVIRRLI